MIALGLLVLGTLWLTALVTWLAACHSAARKWGRRARVARNVGVGVWLAVGLFVSVGVGKELLLDEPLARAAGKGDVAKVRSLLAHGASPNATYDHCPAIILAGSAGRTQVVRVLLKHGADPDAVEDGPPAVYYAAYNGDTEVVQLLVDHGADPNARGPEGTALSVAKNNRCIATVRVLEKAGAKE